MTPPAVRLGVLLSGRGSNFQAIVHAIETGALPQAEVAVVLSNKADAPGLAFAQGRQIPTEALSPKAFPNREAYDEALLDALRRHQVDVVILAGYTRLLTPVLLQAFPHRILNIHPSLLPAYGGPGMFGERVHQAVLAAGEAQSGCSVHVVTEVVDGGPVLGQAVVDVLPGDTPETLAHRVLQEEHRLYPAVIRRFIEESRRHVEPLPETPAR